MAKTINYLGSVHTNLNPKPIEFLDLSRETIKQFTEVAAYTKNDKGEFINETAEPILVPVDDLNVNELIQSYRDEVDLKKIVARASISGDSSLVNVRPEDSLVYGDTTVIPDNMNDAHQIKHNTIRNARAMFGNDIVSDYIDGKDVTEKIKTLLTKAFDERFPSFNPDGSKKIIEEGGK